MSSSDEEFEEYYNNWGTIGEKASEEWPDSQALSTFDLFKLRDENGIYFTRRLGRGAFGDVWKIEIRDRDDTENREESIRELACKVIRLSTAMGITVRDAVSELLKELKIIKRLKHNHIVRHEFVIRLYDPRSAFPHPIITLCFMELMNGSLKDLISWAGKLPEPVTNEWFVQIANALKYIHDQNIAHLDIKSENILVKRDPNNTKNICTKLTDFGLSEVLEQSFMTDATAGTFPYRAPEIDSNQLFDGFKTDIYSLGITLTESLCGVDKIDKDFPLMLKIVKTIQEKRLFRAISQDLQDLIRGMTLADPQNRMDINQVMSHQWTLNIPYIAGKYFQLFD